MLAAAAQGMSPAEIDAFIARQEAAKTAAASPA
jgi:hypothetical protein